MKGPHPNDSPEFVQPLSSAGQASGELDVAGCRARFPALARTVADQTAVFFDGPAGSQVPMQVIEAMANYLRQHNANHGGVFATSQESDRLLHEAHEAVAHLLGATDPECVVFGANMTTLTFAFSRALARTWQPGDEVLVTRLDHDANVTPWVLAAQDRGVRVQKVELRAEDCTLDWEDFQAKLNERTRLVAIGAASNSVGTINPLTEVVRRAHAVGAEVFVDAVHYAPHGLIDVASWDCDYLVCSAYKFFGPHVGILWGRRERLEAVSPYKVRPAADTLPGRWMTGTQNHEGIVGVRAAVDYLAELGGWSAASGADTRRAALVRAYTVIATYERRLCLRLLETLARHPDVHVWGITNPARVAERVPTVSITHSRRSPIELAAYLAERGIFVWHGNYYALELSESLGREPEGMVRIGLLHYNTEAELARLDAALAAFD